MEAPTTLREATLCFSKHGSGLDYLIRNRGPDAATCLTDRNTKVKFTKNYRS
jgi:hypothetical protein